jgi:very-short-patch-repair endonuclease
MTHYAVSPKNRANARKMRKQLTDAELKLWNELRAHRLMGLAFRRQMPIAGYIVDFACASKKLIVELDGSQHGEAENASADRIRTVKLQALGWTVLRFWNDDVIRDIDAVCDHIVIAAGLMAEDASRQAAAIAQREAVR